MRTTAGERRAKARRNLILLIVVLVLLAGAYVAYQRYEESQHVETRGELPEGFGVRKRVTYDGHTYAEKPAMTTILIMGIDKTDDDVMVGARAGGQADFLLLLVVDHQNGKIHQLQIDRDTMTPVGVLGVLGNPVGTRTLQISLAHGFGLTEEACCENTVDAASNLLEGIKIDHYFALNMDAMSTVNHLLGGVTITFDQDYTDISPSMRAGETVTLTDEQAALFLRARMSVGEGTNAERMARHRLYLHAASETLRSKVSENVDFINEFFTGLEQSMTTNMSRTEIINEVNEGFNYEVVPITTLEGEHSIGSDGFMQFQPAEGAALEWVINTCYERVD